MTEQRENKERLKKRLKRLENRQEMLEKKYLGKEDEYAGYDLGYVEGQIRELKERVNG